MSVSRLTYQVIGKDGLSDIITPESVFASNGLRDQQLADSQAPRKHDFRYQTKRAFTTNQRETHGTLAAHRLAVDRLIQTPRLKAICPEFTLCAITSSSSIPLVFVKSLAKF